MDRSDFLKLLGVGAAASVVPLGAGGESEEKIVSDDPGHDYEELYQIMMKHKPFSVGGVEFVMTSLEQECMGWGNELTRLSATILATGKIT